MARLLSVNVGKPREIQWRGRTVYTGIWKEPVAGKRMVRRLNVDGDGQGDLAGHGGEQRAVFAYQIESYRYWEAQLGRQAFDYGQFGENFTVDGLADAEVCVGDRYRIGGVLLEVTQPRVTCYRVGIRMDDPEMAALLVRHGRPGFYLRVLEEGEVAAGDEIVHVSSPSVRMSIAEINALLYLPGHSLAELERALSIPALSEGWRKSFRALLAQRRSGPAASGNAGLASTAIGAPAWSGFRAFRVANRERESASVVSLTLEPVDGKGVSQPLPGQFIALKLGPETETGLIRCYSLSGDPDAPRYRVSVKREVHGAASSYIDESIQVGDVVQATAPRGSFSLKPGDTPVILLSAGIGLTPVLAMLHALAAQASSRETWWIYGARNGGEHPFAGEVHLLLASLAHAHSHICYSAPRPEDRREVDFDAAGRIDAAALKALDLPRDADFYVCGPAAFMEDVPGVLRGLGVAADHIHMEMFGSGPAFTPGVSSPPGGPPHVPAGVEGSGPLVSFARSGLSVHWNPLFHSLLELAEACDVPVRWSCRSGVCHNCESGLLGGTVAYRPDPVDAPADGNLLICCACPETDLVLDL